MDIHLKHEEKAVNRKEEQIEKSLTKKGGQIKENQIRRNEYKEESICYSVGKRKTFIKALLAQLVRALVLCIALYDKVHKLAEGTQVSQRYTS